MSSTTFERPLEPEPTAITFHFVAVRSYISRHSVSVLSSVMSLPSVVRMLPVLCLTTTVRAVFAGISTSRRSVVAPEMVSRSSLDASDSVSTV